MLTQPQGKANSIHGLALLWFRTSQFAPYTQDRITSTDHLRDCPMPVKEAWIAFVSISNESTKKMAWINQIKVQRSSGV